MSKLQEKENDTVKGEKDKNVIQENALVIVFDFVS